MSNVVADGCVKLPELYRLLSFSVKDATTQWLDNPSDLKVRESIV
jgi:hypothetical protein